MRLGYGLKIIGVKSGGLCQINHVILISSACSSPVAFLAWRRMNFLHFRLSNKFPGIKDLTSKLAYCFTTKTFRIGSQMQDYGTYKIVTQEDRRKLFSLLQATRMQPCASNFRS